MEDEAVNPSKLLGQVSQLRETLHQIRDRLSVVLPDTAVGKGLLGQDKAATPGTPLSRELRDLIETATILRDEISL